MKFSNLLPSLFLSLFASYGFAQAPAGYYNNADGKKEQELKTALYEIIKSHTVLTYSQLWTDFKTMDVRDDGYVWDIYDNKTKYVFGDDQDKGGGDANTYNREHSFPKSWFGSQTSSPMYTDRFHIYPCDSKANSVRSNLSYGEISGTSSWTNGYSKSGKMEITGFSGTVFEPADELKGDFARTYFYFATRYENEDFTRWTGSAMLALNKYPFFSAWSIDMLLRWNAQDPVSKKEINRNEIIYKLQGNRNPYIDHQELAEYIWGNKKETAWDQLLSSLTSADSESLYLYATDGKVYVIGARLSETISVYDMLGNKCLEKKVENHKETLELNTGIYIVRIGNTSYKVINQK